MIASTALPGEDLFCGLPDGRTLCYRSFGPGQGIPLVLIAGLGLQLTYWPPSLIAGLVDRGFRVIVFDNRDVGRSSPIDAPPPSLWRKILRRPRADAYSLGDMAADVRALLDHLGIHRAHLVGMSMGGMIAQVFAARFPERTVTLTSIFSTTGSGRVGQPALSSLMMLMGPAAKTRDEAVLSYVKMTLHIGPTRFPIEEEALALYAAEAWQRGPGDQAQEGIGRQIGAILKSGDRTAELRTITAPTLVIHGDRDPMVATSGGYATAAAIRGADLVLIAGMGHFISHAVSPYLLDLLHGHARRAVDFGHGTPSSRLAA